MSADPNHVRGGSWPGSARVAQRIHTRLSWPRRAVRWVRCAWLRYRIWETERYLVELQRDGIIEGISLREFRRQIEEMRCDLAILDS